MCKYLSAVLLLGIVFGCAKLQPTTSLEPVIEESSQVSTNAIPERETEKTNKSADKQALDNALRDYGDVVQGVFEALSTPEESEPMKIAPENNPMAPSTSKPDEGAVDPLFANK